jgi:hypothetical protein
MAYIRNAYKTLGIQKRIDLSARDRLEEVNWAHLALDKAKWLVLVNMK